MAASVEVSAAEEAAAVAASVAAEGAEVVAEGSKPTGGVAPGRVFGVELALGSETVSLGARRLALGWLDTAGVAGVSVKAELEVARIESGGNSGRASSETVEVVLVWLCVLGWPTALPCCQVASPFFRCQLHFEPAGESKSQGLWRCHPPSIQTGASGPGAIVTTRLATPRILIEKQEGCLIRVRGQFFAEFVT